MSTSTNEKRSRLDPPIPATYFGNCDVKQMVVAFIKEVVGNDGFTCALEGISEALNRVKDEGVLNGAERWVWDMNEFMEGRISILGSPRFEVYSIDFGCGRPKKVDISSIDGEEAFSLNESRDIHGGVEID
ncbi:unnamed protein product [Sphenostylis stenocarpa]|uniref:Uncharacterized protein n=1 Tax=Sphenostylis stenocarpa TaxID=92480 RepID=A0AA86S8F3_9FABA|nr:unnamed protein product [Sphenostylis stenocarpa]